mmetsp:Transcript_10533/g.42970  ORF Transcript_10533/g.42970 Transcript_10533/m.42970 type:complete len:239 (+) Transcript_10533:1096-1812(+)
MRVDGQQVATESIELVVGEDARQRHCEETIDYCVRVRHRHRGQHGHEADVRKVGVEAEVVGSVVDVIHPSAREGEYFALGVVDELAHDLSCASEEENLARHCADLLQHQPCVCERDNCLLVAKHLESVVRIAGSVLIRRCRDGQLEVGAVKAEGAAVDQRTLDLFHVAEGHVAHGRCQLFDARWQCTSESKAGTPHVQRAVFHDRHESTGTEASIQFDIAAEGVHLLLNSDDAHGVEG